MNLHKDPKVALLPSLVLGLKLKTKSAAEVHGNFNCILGSEYSCSVYCNTVYHCCCTISSFRMNEKRGIQGQLRSVLGNI